jgi:hypothetical protein
MVYARAPRRCEPPTREDRRLTSTAVDGRLCLESRVGRGPSGTVKARSRPVLHCGAFRYGAAAAQPLVVSPTCQFAGWPRRVLSLSTSIWLLLRCRMLSLVRWVDVALRLDGCREYVAADTGHGDHLRERIDDGRR